MLVRYAEEKKLSGYFGPLIDNFTLQSPVFRTAVEVAGGNALYHIVVDSDTTAALLMKELERKRAGRLTFLPLNKLRTPVIPVRSAGERGGGGGGGGAYYPESSAEVCPLIEKLEYDKRFEMAIREVTSN